MKRHRSSHAAWSAFIVVTVVVARGSLAESAAAGGADAAYIAKFHEKYTKAAATARPLEGYATPARYDELFLGKAVDKATENVSNDSGGIAWGLSYQMMSLNEMYRITHDIKYLNANLRIIQAVLAARDDKHDIKLWTGEVAPAWGCNSYAERGRAIFAVHTGIIVYPILDCLLLERDARDGIGKNSELFRNLVADAEKSIAFHERQWRNGPARDEGHYVGLNQEKVLEGKPLPGNRLSSMGRALWVSWKLTGNKVHYDHAIRLGKYIKHRLALGDDGAYYWSYSLPETVDKPLENPGAKSEDSSHGTLTVSFPVLLASEGKVFNKRDMTRFGRTVTHGLGRMGGGVLLGNVAGTADSNPAYIAYPAYWLAFAHAVPEVRPRILDFYLINIPTPGALDMALLMKYAH